MTAKRKGTLEVKCCSGRDLLVVQKIGKQDPFLQFEYNTTTQRIRADNNGGQKPVWNEVVTFNLLEGREKLGIQCYDENLRTHAYIGEVVIELKKVLEQHTYDAWFALTNNHKNIPAGEIYLEFTYYPADGSHMPFDPAKKPTFFAPVPINLPAKPAAPNPLDPKNAPPGPIKATDIAVKPKLSDVATTTALQNSPSPTSTVNPQSEVPTPSPLGINQQASQPTQVSAPATPPVKPPTSHDAPALSSQTNHPSPGSMNNLPNGNDNATNANQSTASVYPSTQPVGAIPIPGQAPTNYPPPLNISTGPQAQYNPLPSAPPLHDSPSYSNSPVQQFPPTTRPTLQQYSSTPSGASMQQPPPSTNPLAQQPSPPLPRPPVQQYPSLSHPPVQQPSPPLARPPIQQYPSLSHPPVQQPSPPLGRPAAQQYPSLSHPPVQQPSPPLGRPSAQQYPSLSHLPVQQPSPPPARPSVQQYPSLSHPPVPQPSPPLTRPPIQQYSSLSHPPVQQPSPQPTRPLLQQYSSSAAPIQPQRHTPPLPSRPTQNTPPLPSRQNLNSSAGYSPPRVSNLSRPGSYAESNASGYSSVNGTQYLPPQMPDWNNMRPTMPEAFPTTGRQDTFQGTYRPSPMHNSYMGYTSPFPEPPNFPARGREPSFPGMGMPMPDEYVHDQSHFSNYDAPYAQPGGYSNPMFPTPDYDSRYERR